MADQYRPSPERVAQYLYKMILRKYNGVSEKYKILMQEDHPDRIEAEVEIVRRLSTKVYNKLRSHRVHRLPGETIPKYCKKPELTRRASENKTG